MSSFNPLKPPNPFQPAPLPRVASPCINICRMHEASGWCEGCARTLAEIAAWGGADDATRLQILAQLPERRRTLIAQGVFTVLSADELDMP